MNNQLHYQISLINIFSVNIWNSLKLATNSLWLLPSRSSLFLIPHSLSKSRLGLWLLWAGEHSRSDTEPGETSFMLWGSLCCPEARPTGRRTESWWRLADSQHGLASHMSEPPLSEILQLQPNTITDATRSKNKLLQPSPFQIAKRLAKWLLLL